MTGYKLPDLISPTLDDQSNHFSTENEQINFDMMLDSESHSPVIGEHTNDDAQMFDSYDIDQFLYPLTHSDSNNSLGFGLTSKSLVNKSGRLSVFASEEPHIKEELDTSSCGDDKINEMEVAAVEEVVTDQDYSKVFNNTEQSKAILYSGSPWFQSAPGVSLVVPKQEIVESKPIEDITALSTKSSTMTSLFKFSSEGLMINLDQQLNTSLPYVPHPQFKKEPTTSTVTSSSKLHLDIDVAMIPVGLYEETLPDTPELLKPILIPNNDFDLVTFIENNGDSNSFRTSNSFREQTAQVRPAAEQRQRGGKSRVTLENLKASQNSQPRPLGEDTDTAPGPSERLFSATVTSTTASRPRRESATRFNRLLGEGFFESSHSNQLSSEGEDSLAPPSKRRRTVSTSRRRHLASDTDPVSLNEARYRERRDKNNLSSQKSRQKKKQTLAMQRVELERLEEANLRLKTEEAENAAEVVLLEAQLKAILHNKM